MNERINELAGQALAELAITGWDPLTSPFNLFTDRFAELIVGECNRTITNNGIATSEHDQCVRRDCVNEILDNFGINTLL